MILLVSFDARQRAASAHCVTWDRSVRRAAADLGRTVTVRRRVRRHHCGRLRLVTAPYPNDASPGVSVPWHDRGGGQRLWAQLQVGAFRCQSQK